MRERRAWDRNFSDIIREEQFGAEVLADLAQEQWDWSFSAIIREHQVGTGCCLVADPAQEQHIGLALAGCGI